MASIKEVVDAFLTYKGCKRGGGNDGDATPILPLIMMDSALTLWKRHIAQIECRQMMKKTKNEWKEIYHKFNMDYFKAFDEEQTDFVCDLMDDFEAYIDKHLTIAFWQITNEFKDEDIERQKVIAACMLIGVLTQSAIIVWEKAFERVPCKTNINLNKLYSLIYKWLGLYRGNDRPYVNVNKNEQVCMAVDALCKHEILFLRNYYVKHK